MASPTPTANVSGYTSDPSTEMKNYSNYSMVMRALLLEKIQLAANHSADYVRVLTANKAKLSSKDHLIIRFGSETVAPKLLSRIMIDIVTKQNDGVNIAGDLLLALCGLSKWKVHSILDNMMRSDKASAEKVITYMKDKGYKPLLWFKY